MLHGIKIASLVILLSAAACKSQREAAPEAAPTQPQPGAKTLPMHQILGAKRADARRILDVFFGGPHKSTEETTNTAGANLAGSDSYRTDIGGSLNNFTVYYKDGNAVGATLFFTGMTAEQATQMVGTRCTVSKSNDALKIDLPCNQ